MALKEYLRFSWVPILLSLTVTITDSLQLVTFDPLFFLACLPIFFGHFYITHLAGAKYYAVHNSSKMDYWRISSISYLPFILSFWVFFWVNATSGHTWEFDNYNILILGLLLSFILFAALIIKKVKMDLDAVIALLFIIGIVGALTMIFFSWLVLRIIILR